MKKANPINLILLLGIFCAFPAKIYSQATHSNTETKMETTQTIKKSDTLRQIFIDK